MIGECPRYPVALWGDMMIIEIANEDTQSLGGAEIRARNDGEAVVFDDECKARVKAEVGEYLAEANDDVSIVKDERGSGDPGSSGDNADDSDSGE